MTEAEWRDAVSPRPMLRALQGRIGVRELMLFAYSCCDRIRGLIHEAQSIHALAVLRRALEGQTQSAEIEAATKEAQQAVRVAVRAYCVPILGEAEFDRDLRMMRTGPDPFEIMASADPDYLAASAVLYAVCCVSDPSHAEVASRFAAEAVARTSTNVEKTREREWANQATLLRQIVGESGGLFAEKPAEQLYGLDCQEKKFPRGSSNEAS